MAAGYSPTAEDRRIAAAVAEEINEYWRARGVEANARVLPSGAIESDLSRGQAAIEAGRAGPANRRRPPPVEQRLADRRARILAFLERRGAAGARVREIGEAIRVHRDQLNFDLRELAGEGVVEIVTRTEFPMRWRVAAVEGEP